MEKSAFDSPDYQVQKVSVWPIAVKYGILGALATIAITMTSYFTGGMDPAAQMENGFSMGNIMKGMGIAVVGYILYTLVYYLAVKAYRDGLGGFITFGQGFKVAFFSVLIKAILVAIFLFIFYQFIAPDFLTNMLDVMEEMLVDSGQNDDQVDMMMGIYGVMYTPLSFSLITGFATLIGGAILSIVAAAIGQKEPSV